MDAAEEEGGKVRRGEGVGGSCRRSRSRRRRTTTNTEDLVPPDGGWGWVIVFANCITTVSSKTWNRLHLIVFLDNLNLYAECDLGLICNTFRCP